MTRALCYVRQSLARAGETEESSLSLRSQEQLFREWCARTGATPVAVVADHDLKGTDPDRPGLAELRQRIAADRIDVLWLFRLDRLARDLVLQLMICRELERANVSLYSHSEGGALDDSFLRGLFGLLNERYTTQQSIQLRSVMRKRALDGEFPPGRTPYGYVRPHVRTITRANGTSYQGASGSPEIHPEQAAVVRQIFAWFDAGVGLREITRRLNAAGVRNSRGEDWHHTPLRSLIQNPIYCGRVVNRGAVVAERPAWAIVSPALWDRCQTRISTYPKERYRSARDRHWLEGSIFHSCGAQMHWGRNGGSAGSHFTCNRKSYGTCSAPRRVAGAGPITIAVKEALRSALGHVRLPDDALRLATLRAGGPDVQRQRAALDRRAETVETRHRRMLDRFAEGKLSADRMDDEDARRAAALAEIAAEREALPDAPDPDALQAAYEAIRSVASLLDHATDEEWGMLLRGLGRVIVGETTVTLDWHPAYRPLLPSVTVPCVRRYPSSG
jgi:DNA invertase Pin-like site-specific DNA recombinase